MFRVLFLICYLLTTIHSDQWNYGNLGPDIWSDHYPLCAGKSQSPINILTACTTYKKLTSFEFTSAYNEQQSFTLENNGHTITGTISKEYNQLPIQLTGGGLNGTFEFVNFHLHWGENHKSGSEHQINGIKYAGEIHFVYMNPLTSQIAVLGIFMQSYLDNHRLHDYKTDITQNEWQRYLDIIQTLKKENDSIVFNLNIASLMGDSLQDFWRYEGSLTTPPCTEGIIWTMFKQPIIFMESQMKSLRDNIYLEDYRGPQPLYNRMVYRNFFNETLSSIPDYNRCLLDTQNEINKEKSSIFGGINCSIYSIFLLISILIFLMLVLCKNRPSIRRGKVE